MNLRLEFLLDPDIHFLNHGSFGACPRPVFETYQHWQRKLEARPVEFLDRRVVPLMAQSRQTLAEYLNCHPDDLVYFPNPTTAVNMLVRSLDLKPGDEILTTDHEYGAMDRTWNFITEKTGALYRQHPILVPLTTPQVFIEDFWHGVTPETKIIFISHITSQTALTFPVAEICKRAREQGIITIIDGAHAPGQIPVDIQEIAPDFYTGACHKWLCAPKGSAFLYTRHSLQRTLNPLVVSWGYQAEEPSPSQYIDHHEWQGTRDLAAFLSVPAAIEFQRQHDWPAVQVHCHTLLQEARSSLLNLFSLPPICPSDQSWYHQMAALQLPELDIEWLQAKLYQDYKIEIPLYRWQNKPYLRLSIQAYNNEQDTQALLNALEICFSEIR